MVQRRVLPAMAFATTLILPAAAATQPFSGGLPGQIEGAADGVLTPGPQLAGDGEAVGGTVAINHARLTDAHFTTLAANIVLDDRLELSAAQANLGFGSSDDARQNVFAARVRVLGSADSPLGPAASVGISHRRQRDFGLERSLGASQPARRNDWDTMLTVGTGQQLGPAQALLLHATARYTRANAGGLLGFGGDRDDSHRLQLEAAFHASVSPRLTLGTEYRQQPDYLPEDLGDAWWTAYLGYATSATVHVTAGWQDQGRLGGAPRQRGPFIALRGRY